MIYKLAFVTLIASTSLAFAQAPIEKTFTITLTEADLVYIARTLHTRPYGEVVDLLAKIQVQVEEQNVVEPEPPATMENDE